MTGLHHAIDWGHRRRPHAAVPRLRLRDRVAARVRAFGLDLDLAQGVAPDASAAHALRAHRLIGAPTRADLAEQLDGVLEDARRARRPLRGVHPRRDAVLEAAEALGALARALRADGPVDARGVARTSILLGDGTGPLYSSRARDSIGDVARRAAAELHIDDLF